VSVGGRGEDCRLLPRIFFSQTSIFYGAGLKDLISLLRVTIKHDAKKRVLYIFTMYRAQSPAGCSGMDFIIDY
jgi:hypothetical protein